MCLWVRFHDVFIKPGAWGGQERVGVGKDRFTVYRQGARLSSKSSIIIRNTVEIVFDL